MAGSPARLFADGGVADRLGLSSWAAEHSYSPSQPNRKALAHLIAPSIKKKRKELEDKYEHQIYKYISYKHTYIHTNIHFIHIYTYHTYTYVHAYSTYIHSNIYINFVYVDIFTFIHYMHTYVYVHVCKHYVHSYRQTDK